MKTRGTAGLVMAAAMAAVLAVPLDAQQGRRGRGMGPGPGPGPRGGMMAPDAAVRRGPLALDRRIEAALQHRETLGLDDAQVQRLEELGEAVEDAQAVVHGALDRLREEARANAEERAAMRRRMLELREDARAAHAPLRDGFDDILTGEQERELNELLWQERGRPAGPGLRGGRGMRPRGGVR